MVTEIGGIASFPITAPRDIINTPSVSYGAGAGENISLLPSPAGSAVSISGRALPGYGLSQADESVLDAALHMRQAQDTSSRADRILADIQSNLLQLVKQYPPFGVDSPERIQYLNAITGLRKQLEALEYPPQNQTGQGLPAPRLPDPASLRVPALDPHAAPDEAIQSALDFVIQARGALAQGREEMWSDVQNFIGAGAAEAAIDKVKSVREFVALNPGSCLGMGKRQLIALCA